MPAQEGAFAISDEHDDGRRAASIVLVRRMPDLDEGHEHVAGEKSGKGCDDCRGTGYRGRTGVYELFVITEEARGLILGKKPTGVIRRHAIEHGMVSLRDDGWAKARAGITTVEEILRVTQEDT